MSKSIDDTIRGIENNIADMDRRTKAIGRKVRYALNPFVALGRNQQEALDTTIKQIFDHDPVPDARKIESRMIPATKAGLIGAPEAVLRQLRRYQSLGIELVLCKMIPNVDNVRHIADEIIAPMRGGASSLPKAS